ncbi:MAG: hypothetical protein QME32_08190, partial [Endomicrobiia bacterium]|nr:hypothetical protein [Endomicrobiia bacterium]
VVSAAPLAASISTPTADIVVTNLRIGQTYNLSEIANMPFRVKNHGIERRIKINLLKPATNQTREGFEPVPNTSWVTLPKTEFHVLPGETAVTDIIIKIPDDESLLGRQFEAKIRAETRPKNPENEGMVAVGLAVTGSLRFSIAPKPPTAEELEKFSKARFKVFNLSLVPNDLELGEIPIGKNINAEKTAGKFLRIANVADEPVKIRLKCVPVVQTGLILPEGWEPEPDTSYLKFPSETVIVKGMEIKKINFSLNFPKDEKYRNKKYLFIVEASVEGELVRTTYRSKVYIQTK